MNNKRLIATIPLLLAVVFMAVISYRTLPRNLGQVYPELVNGTFTGYLKHGEQTYMLSGELENQKISELLQDTDVKPGVKTNKEPETAFCLRFSGNEYLSIVVGQDGDITLAEIGDLEETRRFWKDDGGLFSALYAYHLQLGGKPLPEA